MKNKFNTLIFFLCYISLLTEAKEYSTVDSLLINLKQQHNVKLNQNLIDVSYQLNGDTICFKGSVTNPIIISDIQELPINEYIDTKNIKVLPDTNFISTPYGLINVSVADLRTSNRFTAGMATQELLGTPVKLLEEKNGWIRVQCPNLYFGWIPTRQVIRLHEEELDKWKYSPKIIFDVHYGITYKFPTVDKHNIISDLVLNDVLVLIAEEGDFYKVEYPDKRVGFVLKSEAKLFEPVINQELPSIEEWIQSIMTMQGLPYVWGGLSTKGVDCSGLVNAALRTWGLLIYRDASQQALVGAPIELTHDYKNLQRGDLMFFGSSKDNIRHVGVYLGNNQFIHASGWTRTSSLNPEDDNFDELNTREFVIARRYFNDNELKGAWRLSDSELYTK